MFHKIRNLHPNVRVGAEKVLDRLQKHYDKIATGMIEGEMNKGERSAFEENPHV